MEARISRAVLLAAILFCSMGAQLRSTNFIIDTPDAALARKLSAAAEKYRHDLAIEWLGKPMPNWSRPCPITVRTGKNLGAGGATTFVFDQGEVHSWRMSIQGSVERVFDSVLPHEITHMIYASHFRQPLPRWADEGGATSVEHSSERAKHRKMLDRFLRTGRGISFSRMFAMTEYPADVMPLYAQGFSLSEYLIQSGGRKKYVVFMGRALKDGDWSGAIRRNYGFADLGKLQNTWLAWVKHGSPPLKHRAPRPGPTRPAEGMLATNALAPRASGPAARRPRPEPNLIYREPAVRLGSYAPAGVIPAAPLVAVNPPSEAKLLPSSGWHAAGSSLASRAVAEIQPRSDPFRAQVTRPLPIETPRQIILEWNGR